jgi:hypothetical protein
MLPNPVLRDRRTGESGSAPGRQSLFVARCQAAHEEPFKTNGDADRCALSAIGRHEQVSSCLPSRLSSWASAPESGELPGEGPALAVTGPGGGRARRQIHHAVTERAE